MAMSSQSLTSRLTEEIIRHWQIDRLKRFVQFAHFQGSRPHQPTTAGFLIFVAIDSYCGL